MAKASTRFICRACGAIQARWMGKCPDCGQWDALEEYKTPSAGAAQDRQRGSAPVVNAAAGMSAPQAMPIESVGVTEGQADAPGHRLATGMSELDRVLGGSPPPPEAEENDGAAASSASKSNAKSTPVPDPDQQGLVPGGTVLVGGDPGIGKSTLLLQAAHQWAVRGRRVLYVTSEESAHQLRLRAQRLGALKDHPKELYVLADTNLARILEQARQVQPEVIVLDSIQMIYKGELPAAPGSVTQLRACCLEMVYYAKATSCAVLFVGHVTKEGRLAGPRLLEHMVDTVLYFEGDRYHSHRIIRAIKNRFGSTLEVGLFEMGDTGLRQVADGAGLLDAEYRPMSGSVVCPVLQGSRCLLVEIQALTATGFLGSAKRKTSGIDANRLAMLIAVLEKRGELRLADQDIFASSVGGMKIGEPAADLAVALAIAGAHYNRQVGAGVCAVGEIGLGGEIRHVQMLEQRLREAARLGFAHIICPKTRIKAPPGCELHPACLRRRRRIITKTA
ncbi:MAG: DNA repair protein RadA [Planctomycetota bacterium]|nr:DNA repair protein RadA [Planctomycetota bacterium]